MANQMKHFANLIERKKKYSMGIEILSLTRKKKGTETKRLETATQ